MKNIYAFRLLIMLICLLTLSFITKQKEQIPATATGIENVYQDGLFDSDDILEITLKGNVRDLLKNRTGNPKLFPFVLSYKKEDSSRADIPIEARTRGHFRRLPGNCQFPPILLQFKKEGAQQHTIFSEQKKLKLVMPCAGEEYVIREWLTYKIYNLVTPFSFRARLVKVNLEDEENKKPIEPFYGMLLEEEKQMAQRNHTAIVKKKMRPEQIQTEAFNKMAVFQYLIGNTDWSVQYQQNIKLITPDSGLTTIAVPYDFDHAGLVNAPYAKPAEELRMSSIRQRRYRGYCVQDLSKFNDVLAEYRRQKDEVLKLFTSCTLLDQKFLKSNSQWLEEFYNTINDDKSWQKDFAYPCDKNGTGNVVIRGLKED